MELTAPIGKKRRWPPHPTDAELIAASLDDPARFAELFDRHFAAVFRFAERRVGPDQAGEVASETFTRAFARRGSYRLDVPDALPWLYGIASNLVLHERRRFARYLAAVERVAIEVSVAEQDGGLAAADRRLDAPGEWERMRTALLALGGHRPRAAAARRVGRAVVRGRGGGARAARRHRPLEAAPHEGAAAGTPRGQRENSSRLALSAPKEAF